MNSKELLEQATAKIEKINDLMAFLDVTESVLTIAYEPDTEIAFYRKELGAAGVKFILSDAVMNELKTRTLEEISKVRDAKAIELEQLLGLTPKVAVQDAMQMEPAAEDKPAYHVMTAEVVRELYVNQHMSRTQIAQHFGVTSSVVNNFLYRHKITLRDKSDPEETERP